MTEPGQVEALRPWQPGGPRGGGRGGGRGEDREGEVLKVVEHLEVEDPGLGGALGGAGAATAGRVSSLVVSVTASAGAAAGSAAASGSASPCCGGPGISIPIR